MNENVRFSFLSNHFHGKPWKKLNPTSYTQAFSENFVVSPNQFQVNAEFGLLTLTCFFYVCSHLIFVIFWTRKHKNSSEIKIEFTPVCAKSCGKTNVRSAGVFRLVSNSNWRKNETFQWLNLKPTTKLEYNLR